jgi:hypothetical protein
MVTWKGDTRGEAEGRYERGRALNQMNSHGQERQRPVVDQLYAFLENRALIASVIRQPIEYSGAADEEVLVVSRVQAPVLRVLSLFPPFIFSFSFFPFFLLFPGKAWPFRLSQVGVQSGAEASRPVVPRNAQTSGA